jgi:release factor glutamine methyltransferase
VSPTVSGWLAQHRELPELDLNILLCHRLELNRSALILRAGEMLDPGTLQILSEDVSRLRAGEPLAYVLGEWSFWDFDLIVTPDVLIPRPETETLVEAALEVAAPGQRALDLGTGSGAIAIALCRAGQLQVTAVDASIPALTVAERNAARLSAEVTFLQSDWYSGVSGRFDLIVANPPYIAEGDPHLPALSHEPVGALISGPAGLTDLTRIIAQAPRFLTPSGRLLVEHGYDQQEPVTGLFAAAGFEAIECRRDLAGQPRVTMGRQA